MKSNLTKDQDIPWPLALLLLAIVFGFLATGGDFSKFDAILQKANFFVEYNSGLLTVSVFAALLNIFVVYLFFQRFSSQKRQGMRLKDLLGEKTAGLQFHWTKIISFIAMTVFYVMLEDLLYGFFGNRDIPRDILVPLLVNVALAAAVSSFWTKSILQTIFLNKGSSKELGHSPILRNSLSLGTSSISSTKEDWVSISGKGLNGNILITGSIGSGKTQGTILPYFDQILGNYDPKPSVLAIDPKGTFVRDATEIASKHGLASDVLHLHLDGRVSYNPIFVEDVLKNGRFLDVTQMIRSAAINFSGRGAGDSPFWELSAFNLTKNALILCAAVNGYYTLNDLYSVMLDAVEDRATDKLEEALRAKSFTDEENHNIRYALNFFSQEFPSFDPKVKTGILATATAFLNQFQEFRASRLFCPSHAERTIKSMDDVVDNGQLLFFDITSPGLARAMGTFVKLQYQQSVLNRLTDTERSRERSALLIIDEYQDVVSSGYGTMMGDDRFLAKGREANAITIAATQSLSSLENSLGKAEAAKELGQNFRTRIACHSTDLLTIRTFQDLIGEEDRTKRSHSFSEMSQDAKKNIFVGGFEADNANITESVSTSQQRESIVTGKDFSGLNSFEALSLVFDGFTTQFVRLNLKPYFLKERNTSHRDLKRLLSAAITCIALLATRASGYPNVCDVINQPAFASCLEYQVTSCVCPGIPPRPCARFSYYVPDTYIEVSGEKGSTKFRGLPGVLSQLSKVTGKGLPFGTEGSDFAAFEARTLPVPLASTIFSTMPCSSGLQDTTCFGAMSEHLGGKWSTGTADLKQPNYLLGASSPKACLAMGAARSMTGGSEAITGGGSPSCSVPMEGLGVYPPSAHSACNGWGTFYPRVGMYDGPSQTTAALMVASRMKSLSTEVFQSATSSPDEKWQTIVPSGSQCFREGQNASFLESTGLVNDRGRLTGRLKDYLFVVWRRVSCCKDLTNVPVAAAALASMKSSCKGLGGIP